MSFNWEEFLGLAVQLSGQNISAGSIPTSEARYRTAISRAYYAAHHAAQKELLRLKPGFKPSRKPSIHQAVIREFKSGPTKNWVNVGDTLDTLRKSRNKADYRGNASITQSHAVTAISDALLVRTTASQL